ncbi:MAG: phosphate uptake regulator PhoU [Candidatus Brockarchaeota archaeon]|nr:phosphate uptake regulator PhoU [Candidatus Brockarchaeota archaeon]
MVWKRKVLKAGSSSLLITLPKSWVKQSKIDKGATLTMVSNKDGTLTIIPEGGGRLVEEVAKIDLSSKELKPQHVLLGSYLLGYNTIIIRSEKEFSTAEISEVRKTVRRLPGAEISEETSSQIEVRVLLDPEMITPEKLVRRQSALAASMMSDCVKALVKMDRELAERVIERDEEVDRQYFILVRVIRSALRNPELPAKMGMDFLNLMDLRMLVKYVEDSADQCVQISREVAKMHGRVKRISLAGLSSIGETLSDMHTKAVGLFSVFNASVMNDIMAKHAEVEEKLLSLEEKQDYRPYATSLVKVFNSLVKILENIKDVVELVSIKAF